MPSLQVDIIASKGVHELFILVAALWHTERLPGGRLRSTVDSEDAGYAVMQIFPARLQVAAVLPQDLMPCMDCRLTS